MNVPLEQARGGAPELARCVLKTLIRWHDLRCAQLAVQTKDLLRVQALLLLATANPDSVPKTKHNAPYVVTEPFREEGRRPHPTTQHSSAQCANSVLQTRTPHKAARKGGTASAYRDTETPTTTQTMQQHAARAKTASTHREGTILLVFHVASALSPSPHRRPLLSVAASAMQQGVCMKYRC
tara:strand:+ start:38098 stop:38643 length:546 start_codon:yes stop_codon:yes gene_type:complete